MPEKKSFNIILYGICYIELICPFGLSHALTGFNFLALIDMVNMNDNMWFMFITPVITMHC